MVDKTELFDFWWNNKGQKLLWESRLSVELPGDERTYLAIRDLCEETWDRAYYMREHKESFKRRFIMED